MDLKNSMNILLAINPNHVSNILNGSKRYEYRTRIPKEKINKIFIYSTNPVQKVIAYVDVTRIISNEPNKLWEQTKSYSGIDKDYFDKYFENKSIGYAFELDNLKIYKKPKDLKEFGINVAPQSYCYIKELDKESKEYE